jgi:manganese/zinc-transporting P-type ATPase C
MRIAPGADGVSIWSPEIFGSPQASRIQEFLERAFTVMEVESVELRRATHFGRIRFGAVANPRQLWKKLARALGAAPDAPPPSPGAERALARPSDAGLLFLGGPGAEPIHVSRVGGSLSTWRVRHHSQDRLHLWHPVLRNRRDVVFRLEEELGSILGIEDFRASALTADVAIRFDHKALTVERLVRELEKAWPRLLDGLDGPPSRRRLGAAVGLLGLAFAGQYLVPPLRPLAVAGVLLYSFPNVVNGVKQLARGQVGLYALYSTGLAFMLVSGMPFASSAMAVLMQFWPLLARRKLVRSQRRLFARQRRRALWARVSRGDGVEVEVGVEELRRDDLVVVRSGELVPVDGVVQEGSAVVIEGVPFRAGQIQHRSEGDAVSAGALVWDGTLTIRVERAGAETGASYLASLLPHGPLTSMPSLLEAERIANRNAKPILALSALSLALTRTLRPSQAVIRPDYATGPRLSAQLSALHGLAQAALEGVFFKDPAALDRVARADLYVLDDTAGLERRRVEVAKVESVEGFAEGLVAAYALGAFGRARTEQSLALATFTSSREAAHLPSRGAARYHAGVTRYRDGSGHAIEVATARHVAGSRLGAPGATPAGLEPQSKASEGRNGHDSTDGGDDEPALRSLWVSRDGAVIGVVSFARIGEVVGKQVVAALRKRNRRARFVYLSRGDEGAARAAAAALGVESAHGALDAEAKANLIRGIGRSTVWVGDGSDPEAGAAIAASTVSVSVAPASRARRDLADILMPHQGIEALPAVLDLARAHELRLARDYRTVYTANLLGVGGAFVAQFNALRTGLLSNVGTGLVYARHARALDKLASAVETEEARVRLASSATR